VLGKYTDDGLGNLDVDVIGATDSLTGDVMAMVMFDRRCCHCHNQWWLWHWRHASSRIDVLGS
jgi:hypothetical protein